MAVVLARMDGVEDRAEPSSEATKRAVGLARLEHSRVANAAVQRQFTNMRDQLSVTNAVQER